MLVVAIAPIAISNSGFRGNQSEASPSGEFSSMDRTGKPWKPETAHETISGPFFISKKKTGSLNQSMKIYEDLFAATE